MSYTAIILDPTYSAELKRATTEFVPEGWRVFCHHLTLNMGRMDADLNDPELHGSECIIEIDAIGMNDKAVAVRASSFSTENGTALNSMNKVPHITVAVNTENGAKPKDSSTITMWGPFSLTLRGKILTSGA